MYYIYEYTIFLFLYILRKIVGLVLEKNLIIREYFFHIKMAAFFHLYENEGRYFSFNYNRDPRRYLLPHPTTCTKFLSCQYLGNGRYGTSSQYLYPYTYLRHVLYVWSFFKASGN